MSKNQLYYVGGYSQLITNQLVCRRNAGVAQSVVQLIRNQQVAGSSPVTSSKKGRAQSGATFF